MVLEHIQKLLFDHDCVIMPDFGGLITHYEPVKIHPIRHTFLPPSKRVAFNEKLKLNDGLLISTLAYDYKLTTEEAQLQVMQFVNELQRELNSTRRFDLKGIGIFRLNEESKIVFEYVENENYLNDSFGLPELVSKPVVATEPVILRTLLKESQTKAKPGFRNAVRRYYRAATALMVGGVVVTGLYLLSLQNNYNISAINPITLFQTDSQQIDSPENTSVNNNSISNENPVADIPAEETSLDTFEGSSYTDSDILIASS
ncbi:MAG: SPOR domain-containing protein, partial [Bacteroidota bacterium]|nr:SPOR domain-containing protein [Bacteroidota bacterium]